MSAIRLFQIFLILIFSSCSIHPDSDNSIWVNYDQSAELEENASHVSQRMRFKLIQSKILDKNAIRKTIIRQLGEFGEGEYENLKSLILEQDIPGLQNLIADKKLSYEKLTKWYLYRILKFEFDEKKMLNAIIAIHPDAVRIARQRDKKRKGQEHPIFGMPVLLKDNINSSGLATTAGAHAFLENYTEDAFIVRQMKAKGAIILGKTSLSEWANYLCLGCPNGYSAVGGQTLNPYGRRQLDTGGSSSGSGAAMAANYAAAAVGTETSGSILSPSSKNSLVGLKPTVGLLSRGGIVPISSTLDTPGPMCRNIRDNVILLDAMLGRDPLDPASANAPKTSGFLKDIDTGTLSGVRFGINKRYLQDSLYRIAIDQIRSAGGICIEFEESQVQFENFGKLLSADMKKDLPDYIRNYASQSLSFKTVADIIEYNLRDSSLRIPYGQGRLAGVPESDVDSGELKDLKENLKKEGKRFFDEPMTEYKFDVILSMDNRNAGYAAAAYYPCLTVPMGYDENGEPHGITFIARSFNEDILLKLAYAFEKAFPGRKVPDGYR